MLALVSIACDYHQNPESRLRWYALYNLKTANEGPALYCCISELLSYRAPRASKLKYQLYSSAIRSRIYVVNSDGAQMYAIWHRE